MNIGKENENIEFKRSVSETKEGISKNAYCKNSSSRVSI